jgi:hypothetical protein
MELAHGFAPVRDGTGGIFFGYLVELSEGFFVPEIVQQSDGAIEGCGLRGGAGGGEMDGAQVFGLREGDGGEQEEKADEGFFHTG